MARVDKTIKSSSGDYSSLASFETALSGSSAANPWTALCDSGFDLGEATFNNASYTPTSNAEAPWVVAAPGHQHRGDKTAGAYISATATVGLNIQIPYMEIDGIRIISNGGKFGAYTKGVEGIVLKNMFLDTCNVGIYCFGDTTGAHSATVFNNIIIDCAAHGIRILSKALETSPTITVGLYNNIVNGCTTNGIYYQALQTTTGTPTTIVTSRNNIAVNNGVDFKDANTSGVLNITATHNLSEDATADDWGGAGHLINQTVADIFRDEPNDDYRLRAGSPAKRAGHDMPFVAGVESLAPIHWLRLGEASGSTATDIGSTGGDGTIKTGVSLDQAGLVYGDPDTCMDFPGGSTADQDHITTPWNDSFLDNDFTVMVILSSDSFAAKREVLGTEASLGAAKGFHIRIDTSPSIIMAGHNGTTNFSEVIKSSAAVGVVYHCVVTYNAATGVVIGYVYGVQTATVTLAGGFADSRVFNIGQSDSATRRWDGLIDEVAIFDKVLTPTEIADLYTRSVTAPGDYDILGRQFALPMDMGVFRREISWRNRRIPGQRIQNLRFIT